MTSAEPGGTEPRTAKADAMAFLQAALAGAPVPATQVSRMAHEHGLSPKAIRAAREALGVAIARNGFGPGGRSLWALPGDGCPWSPRRRPGASLRRGQREPGGGSHHGRGPPADHRRV